MVGEVCMAWAREHLIGCMQYVFASKNSFSSLFFCSWGKASRVYDFLRVAFRCSFSKRIDGEESLFQSLLVQELPKRKLRVYQHFYSESCGTSATPCDSLIKISEMNEWMNVKWNCAFNNVFRFWPLSKKRREDLWSSFPIVIRLRNEKISSGWYLIGFGTTYSCAWIK